MDRLGKTDVSTLDKTIGSRIVAIIWQKVIVEFPENVEGDSAVRRQNVVIGLLEHGMKFVQGQMFRQQFMRQFVDLDQGLQLDDPGNVPGLKS